MASKVTVALVATLLLAVLAYYEHRASGTESDTEEIPRWFVGDRWTYSTAFFWAPSYVPDFTYEVVSIDHVWANDALVEAYAVTKHTHEAVWDNGSTRWYRSEDLALMRILAADGSWESTYDPPFSILPIPLEVGAQSSLQYERKASGPAGNSTLQLFTRAEVLSYRSISVPAGTSMAFEISVDSFWGFERHFFAPTFRNFVRMEGIFGIFGEDSVTVLTEAQLKPVGPTDGDWPVDPLIVVVLGGVAAAVAYVVIVKYRRMAE